MKNYDRDLLVMYKADWKKEDLVQHEVECLHRLLLQVESQDIFCTANELATRRGITNRKKSIIKATKHLQLKPFNFLINKN